MKLLSVLGRHLEFQGEGNTNEVGMGTVKKLTFENMGIEFEFYL